jgi:branched-subunit amino acid transport protein
VTEAWVTTGLLAVGTIAIKSVGPLALGSRELPPRLAGVVALLAPSLLAALVVVDTFADGKSLVIDARAGGLAAAAGALALRLPMIVVVGLAAAVTAGLRALGIG